MLKCLGAIALLGMLLCGCHGVPQSDRGPIVAHPVAQTAEEGVSPPECRAPPAESRSGENCAPGATEPDFRPGDDIRRFPRIVWHDARQIANVENGLLLGVSAAAAIGIRQGLDDDVRQETAADPLRWGDASRVLGYLGEAPYQVPVLATSWALSVWHDDPGFHEFNEALLSAYTLSGLATLAIKGATNTDRPDDDWNGGQWGFPSFHAASTFTIAAVLEDYYGWKAGLPAYTLAGLISWSRIDERDHDLSDVVFGAAMGYVIGKAVADVHQGGDGHVRLAPWRHPSEDATGVMMETRF